MYRAGRDCVFFFKQKTAYEMLRSLVGSEMCIRDSTGTVWFHEQEGVTPDLLITGKGLSGGIYPITATSVSYTHLTLPTIYSV